MNPTSRLLRWNADAWPQYGTEDMVVLHLLEGFMDAGQVTAGLSAHVMEHCHPHRVAEIDPDEIFQYRDRRPVMSYANNKWTAATDLTFAVDVLHDAVGQPFLLIHGHEPDLRWLAVRDDVATALAVLNPRAIVTATGAPMAVPHTRPLAVSAHATEESLLPGGTVRFDAELQIPASFSAFLELKLGQMGLGAYGFHVHVPHYLSQNTYARAVLAALGSVTAATGLDIAVGDLDEMAQSNAEAITSELEANPELVELITALEENYDVEMAQQMPSGDEIAAEFQRFLAQRDQDDK